MSCLTDSPCLSLGAGSTPQALAAMFQCLAVAQCLLTNDILPEMNPLDFNEFDYIVVGAGSAGSVIANRLSENENWKILLLEAGSDPPITSVIPGLQTFMYGTAYDWQHLTVNNSKTSQGLKDGSVSWTSGKMLGGSSSINALVYVTGNDQDYQRWYDAGNKEWSVDEVRRCFKKSENLQNEEMLQNLLISEYYGHEGPLAIDKFNNTFRSYLDQIIESWYEIGFQSAADLNMENYMGSGILTATASNGVRQSTSTAYLQPIASRNNLKLLKNALVTKVLIDNKRTAYGVEIDKNGTKLTFYATREVVLSAGSVNSPQLLMLSGIGPQKHLRSNNITCLVDSPNVGQNLQDHALLPITIYGDPLEQSETTNTVTDYLLNRRGTLAQSSLITDAALFYSTKDNASFPNSQNHVSIINKNHLSLRSNLALTFRYNDTVLDSIVELNADHALYFFQYILLHPYSRGNISLKSNDPKDSPLIYSNYFDDSRDLDTAVTAIKMVTKIVNSTYFKSINGFLGRMNVPECNIFELDSTDYWKCISTNLVSSIFHPVGTCQMGSSITTSVVDSRLRVHGVKNLRVIDASVMPTTTSGNTNGPCIMIGERGAELIKEDNSL